MGVMKRGKKYYITIHPFHIEGYKSQRFERVQGATVNRDLACLKRMYHLAIK